MSQTSTLKGQCITELLGTELSIFLGARCVVALRVAGAGFGQWEISIIWGLGVVVAIYLTAGVSGAHPSPVVTVVLWLFACFDSHKVAPFIVSQFAGAFCTAALVYGLYYSLFPSYETTHHMVHGSVEGLDLTDIFSTYPGPYINFVRTFAVEIVITAILMGVILALTDGNNGMPHGPLAPLPIGPLIAVIGASMGPLTGFAMNLARNISPKAFAWLAGWGGVAFTGGKDIPYFLVPLHAPVVGATLGVFSYRKLIGRHLPCDTRVDEEQQSPFSSITQHKASL